MMFLLSGDFLGITSEERVRRREILGKDFHLS
jgi:hypothetical protein